MPPPQFCVLPLRWALDRKSTAVMALVLSTPESELYPSFVRLARRLQGDAGLRGSLVNICLMAPLVSTIEDAHVTKSSLSCSLSVVKIKINSCY